MMPPSENTFGKRYILILINVLMLAVRRCGYEKRQLSGFNLGERAL